MAQGEGTPGKGGGQKGDGLAHRVAEVERRTALLDARVANLEAKALVPCKYCKETGCQLSADGTPASDENELPIVCPKCDGVGQRRI